MMPTKLIDREDELHETASRHTGLYNFGDSFYRQGLCALLKAFESDRELTVTGRQYAYRAILNTLKARLYTQTAWAEYPEVLQIAIQRPLVIVGLPRTGTTALHRLLVADAQFQGLEQWLIETPMIRPPRETWAMHPAYRACVDNIEADNAIMPDLLKMHSPGASEVEECGGILDQSFVSDWFLWGLPTYYRWFLTQSTRDSYRRYADVLRLIGARERHKRWVLKRPSHLAEIESLLEVFPDAYVIQTHRDPLDALPSWCSLQHMFGRVLEGEAARPDIIGQRECAYWREALDRTRAARQKMPTRFFDIDHRRFLADPLGTVRTIYE